MNKKQITQIRKEYIEDNCYFFCNASTTFEKLWKIFNTREEIVQYASDFIKEKNLMDKVEVGYSVLFTYTTQFTNTFYNMPDGIKLRDTSYKDLRLKFLDFLEKKLLNETSTSV